MYVIDIEEVVKCIKQILAEKLLNIRSLHSHMKTKFTDDEDTHDEDVYSPVLLF